MYIHVCVHTLVHACTYTHVQTLHMYTQPHNIVYSGSQDEMLKTVEQQNDLLLSQIRNHLVGEMPRDAIVQGTHLCIQPAEPRANTQLSNHLAFV